jgi:phospholipid/cholesterol/gamma-HCH transport system substrate-binding protein
VIKPAAAAWRLAITGAVAIVLFILVSNVITQPVAPTVRSYVAEFTDASGLYAGADVRVRGVRVGKIQSVELKRQGGQSDAVVGFTLERRFGVVSTTRLAIKYQSLTGSRYVDVANPAEKYSDVDLMSRVPTTMTQPSFDITELFNGLQPVITTLSPEEMNTFTANAAAFLSGDGDGLAPMLESIRTLTKFVSDRQQVVATLMHNLAEVAESMGGHSKDMIQILDWINRPLDGALQVVNEFRKTELYGTDFLTPVEQLLNNVGFPSDWEGGIRFVTEPPGHEDQSKIHIDDALDRAFTNLDNFIQSIKLVPVMWGNIQPPTDDGAPAPCSRGRFQLPEQMDVLLNGQRVILCNH